MKIQEIKQLIKAVEKSDIGEIEIAEEGLKIRISKNSSYVSTPVVTQDNSGGAQLPVQQPTQQQTSTQEQPAPPAETKEEPKRKENVVEIKSPMVGTFYRAPAPDAEPYVEIGDSVKMSQTLCIIEAMKLMNEIQSEYNGKIVDIMVENAQPVEYDQVLFLIEKS